MSFRLIFELEPPRTPDLGKVIRQVEIFGHLADAILIPDNHLGLPAVNSTALAIEVQNRGFKPVVAMNARDRNPIRMRSDFITMRAWGIDEVLLLKGDPVEGISPGSTVKQMLHEEAGKELRKGVLATIGKPIGWRARADYLVTKLAFGRAGAGYWREANGFAHPIYCGVIALPDVAMARKILGNIPDLAAPTGYLEAFESDADAGFRMAIDELDELYRSGIDGAHLVVPAGRRRFASMLSEWIETRTG